MIIMHKKLNFRINTILLIPQKRENRNSQTKENVEWNRISMNAI